MATDESTRRSIRDRMSGAVTVTGFRAGSLVARALPGIVANNVANPMAFGVNVSNRERRAMIERHLRRVNPTWSTWRLRSAVQEAFESYARYWVDSLRLPALGERTIANGFEVVGF